MLGRATGRIITSDGWRIAAVVVLASLACCGDDEERAVDAGDVDVDAGGGRIDGGREPECDGRELTPEFCDEIDNDCDGIVDDGIFCGACTCSVRPPNATPACPAAPDECTIGTCHDGFGDCDGVSSNGCEADLTQPDNCGVCNTVCAANAACMLAGGSYGCDCEAGYTAGEGGCVNVDECTADNGGCDPLTSCTDVPGARTCGPCPTGYARPADSDSACMQVLSGLDVSDGDLSPAFEPTTTGYTVHLPLSSDDVSLIPTAEAGLTIAIEGTTVDSGDSWPSPQLDVGSNAFTVSVAASGRTNTVYDVQVERGHQDAYLKQSNAEVSEFGADLALAGDGRTLAVGGPHESLYSGAVYVFVRPGTAWSQQTRLEPPKSYVDGLFGDALALSADGNTLVVGSSGESSNATGIDGNQNNASAEGSGAVYVFTRVGEDWSQQAYIKASNAETFDGFGNAVALSSDGNTLAVGALGESSAATGVDGNQASNSADSSGAVYVFTRTSSVWSQQAYVKASNTGGNDFFGKAVALAADGNTLAVSAAFEDSAATGIDGNQADNSRTESGAAYVFTRTGTVWAQQAYVKASDNYMMGYFGTSLALGGDGNTLAIGAPNVHSDRGATYLFTRAGSSWSQQALLTASNADSSDLFGNAVALTADGNAVVVGASWESSAATGLQGNQDDDTAAGAGAAYLFGRAGNVWTQRAYLKASNTSAQDNFGVAVGSSADGSILVMGASREASKASGVDGDQDDDSQPWRGAVYVFQ